MKERLIFAVCGATGFTFGVATWLVPMWALLRLYAEIRA